MLVLYLLFQDTLWKWEGVKDEKKRVKLKTKIERMRIKKIRILWTYGAVILLKGCLWVQAPRQCRPGGLCKFLASSRLRKSGTLFEFYFYILARVFFFFGLNKSVTMKECVFSNNTPKLISHSGWIFFYLKKNRELILMICSS